MSTVVASVPVEVKCLDTFAYYPAFVKDFDPKSDSLLIQYENQWKADEWCKLENVRPAAPAFDAATFIPQSGSQVEAMAKSSDEEPYSWWKASVKTVKGEFYLISYSSWEDEFNEILEKEMLRPLNSSPAFSISSGLIKKELPLPADLKSGLDQSHFQPLVNSSEAIAINVQLEPKNSIVIIGNSASVKRATALLAIALKHLVDINKLQKRASAHEQNLSSIKTKLNDGVTETFKLDTELMGLVIGKKGSNIKKAEEEKGVISVKVDSAKGIVTIQAHTAEQAARARLHLEFIEERFPIARRAVGRIVGSKFSNIQEIEKNSEVNRIRVADPKERKTTAADTEELIITGNREAVEMAKMLLEHHIKLLDQVSELSEQERKMSQLAMDDGNSGNFNNFNNRGNNMRGGRGRGRGRGGFMPRNAEQSRNSGGDNEAESRHPFQRPQANSDRRNQRPAQSAFQAAKSESAISSIPAAVDEELKFVQPIKRNQKPKPDNKKNEKKDNATAAAAAAEPAKESGSKADGAEKKDDNTPRPQTARKNNNRKPQSEANSAQNNTQTTPAPVAAAAAPNSAAAAVDAKPANKPRNQPKKPQQQKPKDGESNGNASAAQAVKAAEKKSESAAEASASAPVSAAAAVAESNSAKPQQQNRKPRREKQPASDVPAEKKEATNASANPNPHIKKEKKVQQKTEANKESTAVPATAPATAAATADSTKQ